MKKFRFQLQSVLNFKEQQLDVLMLELSRLQSQERAQQSARDNADKILTNYVIEYDEKKRNGMTVVEALEAQTSQDVLMSRLRREEEALARIKKRTESKRLEVVDMRKEIHSLERLREIRQKEYDTAVMKAEEKSIDDLTAARRAMSVSFAE